MGGVKADGEAKGLHDRDGAHVRDEIVVAKGGAAVGEDNPVVACRDEFVDDVLHIPRREKLPFFYVDGGGSEGGSGEDVCLATEKGGDLDDVAEGAGCGGVFGRVDVGEDGEVEFILNALENLEPFLEAGSAEGMDGGAVGFIVGAFEDEVEGEVAEDSFEFFSGTESELFAFDDAGAAKNGERLVGAYKKIANGYLLHGSRLVLSE